jgi:hypothetical protein
VRLANQLCPGNTTRSSRNDIAHQLPHLGLKSSAQYGAGLTVSLVAGSMTSYVAPLSKLQL